MVKKQPAQAVSNPVNSKTLNETLLKNRKGLFQKDVEYYKNFLALQKEVNAPLVGFYKSAYSKKGAVLKKYYTEMKSRIGIDAGSAKPKVSQIYRREGSPPFPAGPLITPGSASGRKKLIRNFRQFPPFQYSDSFGPIKIGNEENINYNPVTAYSTKASPDKVSGEMGAQITIENEGFVFAVQSIGNHFYSTDKGWTSIVPNLDSIGAGQPVTVAGSGTIDISKRIRVEKLAPVSSLQYETGLIYADHRTGATQTYFSSDSDKMITSSDYLSIGFDRSKGDVFIVWVDVLYMSSLYGGGFLYYNGGSFLSSGLDYFLYT